MVLSDPCLFNWDNIPRHDNLKLIEFLNRRFFIEWVKTAKIEKIDNGKTIKISTEKNVMFLRLDEGNSKVDLSIDNGTTCEFIAKVENNQLNIYEKTRDSVENVFFRNLPYDYKVYILYYPGTNPNRDLTDKLRDLGNIAGKNLFVNIAKPNDPNYNKIANKYGIKTFPTIIVTAIDELASPPTKDLTGYVKIDNRRLLNSPDLAAECIDKMFNLFIQGKISEAVHEWKGDITMFRIKNLINDALKGIGGYFSEWEVSYSFIPGKLEIKHTGG